MPSTNQFTKRRRRHGVRRSFLLTSDRDSANILQGSPLRIGPPELHPRLHRSGLLLRKTFRVSFGPDDRLTSVVCRDHLFRSLRRLRSPADNPRCPPDPKSDGFVRHSEKLPLAPSKPGTL